MDKEIKAKWLTALRSGDYAQGKGALRRAQDDTYCCLGVLCDVMAQEGKGEWIAEGSSPDDYFLFVTDGFDKSMDIFAAANEGHSETAGLPYKLADALGLDTAGRMPEGAFVDTQGGNAWSLVGLNDSADYTFEEIADVIDEHF